eukprot:TRINITY_DN1885_c1_g1_i1.p1 TRINITY_DN1885_c1_g1~~TRINITY_DN1885_c1_g1_i1.p1  ORF type:complete len:545 (+),score=101.27 TRINITY_DN1885_c1_g1_i1:95-1729(+)
MPVLVKESLAAASAGAVLGVVIARCLHRSKEDDDEEAFVQAFEELQGTQSLASKKDVVDCVIEEEEERKRSALLSKTLDREKNQTGPPPKDMVKGVIKTHPDGSRTFHRKELGIEWTMKRCWAGMDEYSHSQAHGESVWVARFVDPNEGTDSMTMLPPSQLVLIVEPVPNLSLDEYAERTKRTTQEQPMEGKVVVDVDCACSVGPFQRKLEYSQVFQHVAGLQAFKLTNYMTISNGVAYTLQLMAPEEDFPMHVGAIEEAAKSVRLFDPVWKRGYILHTQPAPGGGTITARIPTEMIVANDPEEVFTKCFSLGGVALGTYTPIEEGPVVSVVRPSEDEDSSATLESLLVQQYSGDSAIIYESAPGFIMFAVGCGTGGDIIFCATARHTSGVRVSAWARRPTPNGQGLSACSPSQPPFPTPAVITMKVLSLKFAEDIKIDAEKVGTTYFHPANGFQFTISKDADLTENYFGDVCLTYRVKKTEMFPELEIAKVEKKESLGSWEQEIRNEMAQVGGAINESSETWVGREKVTQLVFKYVTNRFLSL